MSNQGECSISNNYIKDKVKSLKAKIKDEAFYSTYNK